MLLKVGVNGFGRIGRNLLRVWLDKESNIDIVAINDLTDIHTAAHLLKYDSVLGRLPYTVEVNEDDGIITVDGRQLKYFSESEPENIPWGDYNVDVVVESTGRFTERDAAARHDAKWVVVSAPCKHADFTTVLGVNDELLDLENHHVISNASCTTNCLAPMVKVLDDNFGIEYGTMVTVHAYTGDQRLLDSPHKDLRRSRSAGLSIVPTTTGAAKAVGLVLPHLAGKLDGYALRVPTPTGSVVDFNVKLKTGATVDEVNEVFREAGEGSLKGVLEYTVDPIVSADIVSHPASVIFDSGLTWVEGDRVRVVGWYDNEWGYSNRLFDLLSLIDSKLQR